jgi:signal transduction histidine kinase
MLQKEGYLNRILMNHTEYTFLNDGGEMGLLTRQFDWSQTPLGSPEVWPQSLRTAVSIVLTSSFPMLLWWGEELIQFYNDAFRPSLGTDGKHPSSLGQPAIGYWTENWHIIKPLIDNVLQKGESAYFEDLPIPNYRNGVVEEVFWTFSYSPVRDESGTPAAVLMTCFESTQKVRSIAALEEKSEQLEFTIDAAELGTWVLDPATGQFTSNARLKRWFGLNADEQVSLDLAIDSIIEADRQRVSAAIAAAMEPGSDGRYAIEYTICPPGASERQVVRARGYALFGTDGICYRLSGTLEDITRQHETHAALEQKVQERTEQLATVVEELGAANEELAESNKLLMQSNGELEQYAYVASHDLQEPLRKISIFSGMLSQDTDLKPSSRVLLGKVRHSAERMNLLIQDLLAFSRLLRSDTLMQPVVLQDIISEVWNDFELVVAEKQATIQMGSLPEIEGIRLQMNQLFYNLINNALKFAAADRPPQITITSRPAINSEVRQRIAKPLPNTTYHQITIADNGIGFEAEYQEQIFEVFKRLHGRELYPGSGIGLALCRRIAVNHHGVLYATSEVGVGSQFHLILPDRQPRGSEALPERLLSVSQI